jgi:hypothetical protein
MRLIAAHGLRRKRQILLRVFHEARGAVTVGDATQGRGLCVRLHQFLRIERAPIGNIYTTVCARLTTVT